MNATDLETGGNEPRMLKGCWVRKCYNHYHITCAVGDLIYPTFATAEEAWARLEEDVAKGEFG